MERAETRTVEHARIGHRGIWHYEVATDVGTFHLVQHEAPGLELIDDYIGLTHDIIDSKAEKKFRSVSQKILAGKI